MGRRIRALVVEACLVLLGVVAAGLCVAGIAALVGYAMGKRGGHEVLTITIVVGAAGLASVVAGVVADPMARFNPLLGTPSFWRSAARQSELVHGEEQGLPPADAAAFRANDMFYAGGVLLLGVAVLFAYACTWAGVPPANPFHG